MTEERQQMPALNTRAILIPRKGPPKVLVEREVPLREPGEGEVHLRVEAAGVNFADLLLRAGFYRPLPPRPYGPGLEVAGVVARVGSGVEGWREGDRAVAIMRHGGYTRDAVVGVEHVYPYPDALTPVQAASVPLVFLTAWVCLFESARARPGETALILGAGGGVGTAAVQLAVRHGLRVIGTAGDDRKRTFVTEELGSDACLDSRADWEPKIRELVGDRGVDIALDPVGGRAWGSCRRLLAPLGRTVFYGLSEALPGQRLNLLHALRMMLRMPRFHPVSLFESNTGVSGVALFNLGRKEPLLRPALDEIFDAVVAGGLRTVVDRTFSLDRAGAIEAHTYLHERRNLGKVVLADQTTAS
ncbi:MAG: zinc-binding dehydrogenase [Gemmatimonadota bacterium]|nr:MAG: zinc-binding dehydrogenase [Gemmatimonadota bacterium]